MLIGSVMYISIFKAEIGSKLRPRSQLQPPLFTFSYGYSFLLYVSGFMAIETAGTCAVFLYIYWHQRDWGMKTLEMTNMNHHRKPSSSSVLLVDQHIYTGGPLYPCRRHPHYAQPIMSNHIEGLSPSLHQRRFYFENDPNDSPPISPNQRVSNVTSTYYSYPEAYQGLEAEGPVMGWDHLPRDLTTQTVSTTADIVNPYFVTFDLDAVPPPRTPTHSLEPPNLVESLRRTTPV
ncbi:hypothetical protein AAG570_011993 [Ranatra chinensis]|uniref:Uncharacterized protein n=1 Tax=Ranatra chinensis TaxID=642074 RepID=A0ABD0YTX9_9HEMI